MYDVKVIGGKNKKMKMKIAAIAATVALAAFITFAFAANSFLYPMSSPVARNIVLENMSGVVLDPTSLTINEPVYEGYLMQFQVLNIGKTSATTVTLSIQNAVGATITLDSAHAVPFSILAGGTEIFTLNFTNIDPSVSTVSWDIGLSYP
jgi:hypothetical protein